MYRIISLLLGLVFVYISFSKIMIKSTPFKGSISQIEQSDVSDYDFFEINDANATSDFAYYLHGKKNDG